MIRRIAERYRLTRYNAGVIAVASVTLGTVLKNAGLEGALYGAGIAALVTLAVDIIVGLLTTLVWVLGTIEEYSGGGLVDRLYKGGEVLGALGAAIGSFFGGITAGSLSKITEGLNKFSQVDINEAETSKAIETVKSIASLAESLNGSGGELKISVFGVATIQKIDGFSSFCENMPKLATAATTFSTEVTKISDTAKADTTKALNVCRQMADFFNDISGDKYTIEKKNNSFISFFTGVNETESFMTYMPKLGTAVRTFASEAEGMGNTTIVKDSKALSKAVGAIADVLTYVYPKKVIKSDYYTQDTVYVGETLYVTLTDNEVLSIEREGFSSKGELIIKKMTPLFSD